MCPSIPPEIETSESTRPTVVRETPCKSILNRTKLGGYSLNCYTGCEHRCVYCYARFMQRFHPHAEPWGEYVDVKVNAVEALVRQLRRAEPDEVFVSSACDGWQPLEAEWQLTRRCCGLLLERGFPIHVLTKSALVRRDFDIFAAHPEHVTVGTTITSPDQAAADCWEPGASNVADRWAVLSEAHRQGLQTSVMFGPLLPGLSDDAASLDALFQRAAEVNVDAIWFDGLNARPKVWEAVAPLLRRRYPDQFDAYRRILFDAVARKTYLASLRERVVQAADRADLRNRLSGCS
jgi:DNA repair photolyase